MSAASPCRSVRPLSLPNDLSPGTTSHRPYNGPNITQGCLKEQEDLRTQGRNTMTINMLTDNVLIEIFDFCQKDHDQRLSGPVWKWHLLVHVCQRWRQIIFASPRRLNLRVLCTHGTPVRNNMGIWPDIPIVMRYGLYDGDTIAPDDEDNVIATLEHPDRLCHIGLHMTGPQLGRITAAMQGPFPVLTYLLVSSEDENVPVIPSSFLARSAPRLQEIELNGVSFPALPTLLLSVSDLVTLKILDTPQIGYISPEVMVAHLAALPRLKHLQMGFPQDPLPDRMLLPPMTRTVLPALKYFLLSCVCEYVEDFMVRIDAPQLRSIEIYYWDQVPLDSGFKVLQLSEFINRSENLKRTLSGDFQITVDNIEDSDAISCYIGGATGEDKRPNPETSIYFYLQCDGMEWKILHLTRMLSQISDIIHFAINSEPSSRSSFENPDYFEWLHLLRPFSSVQTLYVAARFAGHVSRVLQDTARLRVTEVLPALELLCLEDQPVSSVDELIAVRRDSGRPVTIVNTIEEFEKRLEAYPP